MDEELRYKRSVCARIRSARIAADFTQEGIAERLGVQPRTYQNYEYDRIPWHHLGEIAELLGTDVDYLLTGAPSSPTDDLRPMLELLLETVRPGWRELLRPPGTLSPDDEAGGSNGVDPDEPTKD